MKVPSSIMAAMTANQTNWDYPGIINCLELHLSVDQSDGISPLINYSSSSGYSNPNWTDCELGTFAVNPDSGEFDALKEPVFSVLVVTLYVIVILLGAIGNCLVVLTVVKTRQMWTATNVFIASLAVADILVCVFDLPVSAYYQITDDWIFGKALCHVIPSLLAVVVYASTLTLTMVAVDRYLLIVCPLRKPLTVKMALILVVIIATISIGVASPIAVYANYVEINDPLLKLHRKYCMEKWPTKRGRLLYTVLTLIFQYFVPLIAIGFLYFLIFQKVRSRMQTATSCRKTKTTKMLVAVVTVFAIAWTPFHLYAIIAEIDYSLVKGKYYKFTDAMLRVFAMSSSCINPLLYGWLNDNYRNAFLSIIVRQYARRRAIRKEESFDGKRSTVLGSPHRPVKINNNGSCHAESGKQEKLPLRLMVAAYGSGTNAFVAADVCSDRAVGVPL